MKLCCFDISTGQRNLGIHSISSAARSAGELFSPAAPLLPFFRFPRPLSHSFVPLRRSLIFIARARDLEIGAGVLWGRAGRAIYEMGKWQWNEGPKCEFGADPLLRPRTHGWGSPPSCAASNMISKTAAKPKAPPSRNNRNNEDGRRGREAFVTRQIRTEIISDQRHTYVAPSVAAASVCLSVSPAVRQKATREAMEWDGRCTSERHSWCAAPPPPCEIAAKQIGQTGKGGGRWSRRAAAQSSEGPHGQQIMNPNRIL